jgi:hypothetical protein
MMPNLRPGVQSPSESRHASTIALIMAILVCSPASAAVDSLPTLSTAEQVHNLSYEQSLRGYPVHLPREQVLFYNPTLGNLFVADSTRGVYIDARGLPALPIQSGDLLEIEGVTGPGGYAPVVEKAKIRRLGRARLPAARRYSLDHLLTGAEDCQWVEAEGIVRAVENSNEITRYANQAASGGTTVQVTIATGAGRLDVIVREAGGLDYPNLVDAKVAVRGVMGPRFNQQRQLTGVHMFAQSLAQFRVLQPGPVDPFSLPVRPIANVMRYAPDMAPEHRIRVQGVVTANRNGNLLSVADASHGLFIRSSQAHDLKVGDLIDVVGFAAMGEYTPVLEDVVYHKLGRTPLPAPIAATAEEMFQGGFDAELVRIRGRLLKHTRTLQEHTFLVLPVIGRLQPCFPPKPHPRGQTPCAMAA